MNRDLFEAVRFEQLPLPDADVSLMRRLDLDKEPGALLDELLATIPWRQETVTVWGKRRRQPRLVAWYGDPGLSYTYSGLRLDPLPWNDTLRYLKSQVEQATNASFNSVLLNHYRDQQDSMGMHSDDEPELGERPIIASLSLGEERVFVMKHKFRNELPPYRLPLGSGSLLLMKGPTQANWKHGLPKERRSCGPRVNLTFRRVQG